MPKQSPTATRLDAQDHHAHTRAALTGASVIEPVQQRPAHPPPVQQVL
jgi:hypothetical protein